MGCPRLSGEIDVEIYFPDLPGPLGTSTSAIFRGRFGFGKKGHMVMHGFINKMCLNHV